MLPLEFEPARQQEHASLLCARPLPMPNFMKLAPTGLSMTVLGFFWILRQRAKASRFSAVEQSSPCAAYPTRSNSAPKEFGREPPWVAGLGWLKIQVSLWKAFCLKLAVWPPFSGACKDKI